MPLDVETIRRQRPQNDIHYFASVGSTMTEATRLAAAGAPHGTVVLADEQTTGMGRLGRSWESPRDLGVYCSVVLRLPLAPGNLPIASLVIGLATAEAVQKSTQLACDLRWPNDVLIGERKAAGILTHLVDGSIVAGIGINVNQTELPANLRTPATSLRIESNGRLISREDLIVRLLEALDTFCALLESEGVRGIVRAFSAASSYAVHRRVFVEESGATGVTAGLDENGFLLVHSDSGLIERVASGGVRPYYQPE
jgi:BirA family transcriptional regulator, biotin operon repressor / biotin---[acetyl-CoA-carboxylase] ligase